MRDMMQHNNSFYSATNRKSKGLLRFRTTENSFHLLNKKGWSFGLTSLFDNSLRSVAIAVIVFYQRYLSPKKGYSCAHTRLHGGDSCSEYVKKALGDKSLFETTILARKRFKECNIAYTSLNSKSVKHSALNSISVGPDYSDPIGCIIGIVVAILGLIFGKNNGCCK
jgi:putative component of membrane protein insertase Oxa1/YidC/SpoIIIJ protein YidD